MKSSPNSSKNSPPDNFLPGGSSPEAEAPKKKPLWETLVIAASFAGVWIYFFAWLAAGRDKTPLAPTWQLLLVPCLIALFIVFRRRLARARSTMRESQEMRPPRF